MQVSELTRNIFRDNLENKILYLYIGDDPAISNDKVKEETMCLKEGIMLGPNFEFIGCVASEFSISLINYNKKLVGKKIRVSIKTESSEEIQLFNGTIKTCEMEGRKSIKKITAYDFLYSKGKKNVAAWYETLTFPISCRDFRDSLFSYMNMSEYQKSQTLPNDGYMIKKYTPPQLTMLDALKAICQINGVCGIVNRDGVFEYLKLSSDMGSTYGAYPGIIVPGGQYAYPGYVSDQSEADIEGVGFFKSFDYKDYEVKPIDRVTIKNTANDTGVSYGSGESNEYIIQSNFLLMSDTDTDALQSVATEVYNSVKDISFMPFSADINGMPYFEVGRDKIKSWVYDNDTGTRVMRTFFVMNRELKGVQSLRDVYLTDSDEVQNETPQESSTQSQINNAVASLLPETFKVESVFKLPDNPDPRTIYLIRGRVVVQ